MQWQTAIWFHTTHAASSFTTKQQDTVTSLLARYHLRCFILLVPWVTVKKKNHEEEKDQYLVLTCNDKWVVLESAGTGNQLSFLHFWFHPLEVYGVFVLNGHWSIFICIVPGHNTSHLMTLSKLSRSRSIIFHSFRGLTFPPVSKRLATVAGENCLLTSRNLGAEPDSEAGSHLQRLNEIRSVVTTSPRYFHVSFYDMQYASKYPSF